MIERLNQKIFVRMIFLIWIFQNIKKVLKMMNLYIIGKFYPGGITVKYIGTDENKVKNEAKQNICRYEGMDVWQMIYVNVLLYFLAIIIITSYIF